MTANSTMPATSVTPPDLPVAGVDLLIIRERDADHLAFDISADLVRYGATDVTVATHWAQVGLLRHVALSVQLSNTGASWYDLVWTVLTGVVERHGGPFGLLFGDRYCGQPELNETLTRIAKAHATRTSGRAVVFPGSIDLVGTVTVGHAITSSVIDQVRVLAGQEADSSATLVTRDFLRPRWDAGHLVLNVQPAAGRTLVPFETPSPTPCCAYHVA